MVELLGLLLAGYAQVSFWWLSFFVNRLLVKWRFESIHRFRCSCSWLTAIITLKN